MSGRALLRFSSLLTIAMLGAGCLAQDSVDTPAPGHVTVRLGGVQIIVDGASCTWYEDISQLFVEAGDPEADEYLLLEAPLEWLGEALPEGPGEEPALSLRIAGSDQPIEQETLDGTMNAAQTEGTFSAALADGTSVDGEWLCPEVLEG